MHQGHRDIAAQEVRPGIAQAGEEGVAEQFHARDGGSAQKQAEKENPEALEAAAQLAPRQFPGRKKPVM